MKRIILGVLLFLVYMVIYVYFPMDKAWLVALSTILSSIVMACLIFVVYTEDLTVIKKIFSEPKKLLVSLCVLTLSFLGMLLAQVFIIEKYIIYVNIAIAVVTVYLLYKLWKDI